MDEIKAAMVADLQNKTVFTIPLLGGIPVPESAAVSWLIILALTLAAILMTKRLRTIPKHPQMILEMFVGFINHFAEENLGSRWRSFAPFLGSVALYLACANLIGLFGLTPPTKDLSVTAGLAATSVFLIYGASFICKGARGGFHKFAEPLPLMAPINILEIAIRPLSLCMRLFGNVLGSYVVMELIKMIAPVVVPLPFSLYFDVFDGLIQTVVFVFLTTLFTAEAIE